MPRRRVPLLRACLTTLLLAPAGAASAVQAPAPSWAEVRTVLIANCLECHGGVQVRSDFRLADATTFAKGGIRGPVFQPDDPQASRLLEVIRYRNPDLAMPPTGKLMPEELATLEQWVLAGAPWPDGEEGTLADPERFPAHEEVDLSAAFDWWAYRPLDPPPPPTVADPAWAAHPVDAFVRARLDAAGLPPAPQAAPERLLRRASFDLTGLPPTPAERERFLAAVAADGFDAAWGELIDRLLASPHYGEHMARRWLDLVRYAETNGYERDARKTNIWRYRDWVIRAYQDDLPYDRFVVEQLAGDELATFAPEWAGDPERPDPLLATGYYRLGTWDDEPSDPAQARADELADIVDTTGQVFLGATLNCVRCHDHKADPLRIEEYYGFAAYFNQLTGYGGDGFGQHLGGGMTRMIADPPGPGRMTAIQRDTRVLEIDQALRPYVLELEDAVAAAAESADEVFVADARTGAADWRYRTEPAAAGWHRPGFDDSGWKLGRGGFGTAGTPGALVGSQWHSERLQVRTRFALTELPDSLVLSLHHDEDVVVWLNGVQVHAARGYRTDYTQIQLDATALSALVVGSNLLAAECRQSGGGQYLDLGLRSGWLDGRADPAAGRVRLEREADRWLPSARAAEARVLLEERRRIALAPIAEPYPALVASERGGAPTVQRVLRRGSVHAAGEEVRPTVPQAFLAGGELAPPLLPAAGDGTRSLGRRLVLARWMTAQATHLSGRVYVNRLWQSLFGRGLSRAPGDFGRLGTPPTHPGLLDHLAAEAVARGWSTKAMLRYLMTSRTYRMDSVGAPAALAEDPRNELFWRHDPRRLSAEEYRDAVLTVSGQLNRELYGPSVFPPLPAEVLATSSQPGNAWGESSAEQATRRSIYVHVKRSLREPLLAALDQPDPDLPLPGALPDQRADASADDPERRLHRQRGR